MKGLVVSVLVGVFVFGAVLSVAAQQKGLWMVLPVEGNTPQGGALPMEGKVTVLVGPFQDSGRCGVWESFFRGFFGSYLSNRSLRGDCREATVQYAAGQGTYWMMLPVEEEGKIITVLIGAFRDNSVCSRWYTLFESTLARRGFVLRGGCRNTTVQY